MPEQYDVIVVGAGPGGYVAAIRAAQLGQKTAIIDKQWLGGVCLNVGCIPSKALLKNAELAHTLRERGQEFGFSFENLKLDYSAAVKRSRQVSDRLVKGVGFLMKKNKIDVHMGTAHLSGPQTVTVTGADGAAKELSAKNIILATLPLWSPQPGRWMGRISSPTWKPSYRKNYPSPPSSSARAQSGWNLLRFGVHTVQK